MTEHPVAQLAGGAGSKWVVVVATAGAVACFVALLAMLVGRHRFRLERRLAGYERHTAGAGGAGPAIETTPETSVVRQGVDLVERIARNAGVLARIERVLEQADLPVRAAEAAFYVPTFGVLAFLLGAISFGTVVGLVAGVSAILGPVLWVRRRQRTRLRRFQLLLPSTLTLVASSLRAGFSLMQALETAAEEASEPVRREFQRVFTEVRLGRSVEESLADVAARMESSDLAWTVMAIRIQREVGGNLASLLDTVADTMTKRERLRREVLALTAEGRLSAVVLSLFPPGIALIIVLAQPSYLDTLTERAVGVLAIGAAIAANVVGWVWLRRIIDIEA